VGKSTTHTQKPTGSFTNSQTNIQTMTEFEPNKMVFIFMTCSMI